MTIWFWKGKEVPARTTELTVAEVMALDSNVRRWATAISTNAQNGSALVTWAEA